MTRILILIILIGFWACGQRQEEIILSPKEKIKLLPYQDFITISSEKRDTINHLSSFLELDSICIIGASNGIYLISNVHWKLKKCFKFDIKSHLELFDAQDSLVHFQFIDLISNRDHSKLLVKSSNGIVFQINLKTYQIEWLSKFIHGIATATYSDDGSLIAIGTGYDNKITAGSNATEYYSSLFLIDSKTGKFVDHFNESASVKKILFKDQDSSLLVAYGWSNTDSYLWDVNQKDKSISQYGEVDELIYDIAILDQTSFATVTRAGISRWEFERPADRNLVYKDNNTGSEQLIRNKIDGGYILVDYPHGTANPVILKYLDKNLQLIDSAHLTVSRPEIGLHKLMCKQDEKIR